MALDKTILPWNALKATAGEIPWSALEQFSDAVAADASLIQDLDKLHDESWSAALDGVSYAYLYVPVIFALAAPRLTDEQRAEIALLLVAKMAKAGREDDDLSLEVLQAACGTLGAACVPAVLDALAKEPDKMGAWCYLWTLTQLTADSSDAAVRDRVVHASTHLLKQVDRGRAEPLDAIGAAWTLARMGHTEIRPLLSRLVERGDWLGCGDLEEALQLLDGKWGANWEPEVWERPVREWFEPRWQTAKEWYERDEEAEEDDEADAGIGRAEDMGRGFSGSLDDEDVSTAPFAAPSVGRNEPCPCGSGKKYKKCCGAGGKAAPPPAQPALGVADSHARRTAHKLTDKMLDACKQFVPKEEVHAAVRRWTGGTDSVIAGDREETGMFFEYLLHDWRPGDGTGETVAERFAETESARLSPEERAQLNAWLHKRRRGLFEVESVSPATHLTTLCDRLAGDTMQVFDMSLSRSAHRGDLFMTAVFPCGDRLEIGGFATGVPRHLRIPFEIWLRREYADWRGRRHMPDEPASWSRFFSERCPEIERRVKTIGDAPPIMVLTTGEPCAYGYAVYSVSDHHAALKALKAFPSLRARGFGKGNEVEGDYFGWPREQGTAPLPFERPIPDTDEDGRRVLVFQSSWVDPDTVGKVPTRGQDEDIASIYLSRDALEILAMSKERLEYVRPLLEAALGQMISLQRTQQRSPDFVNEIWANRGKRHTEKWIGPREGELNSIGRKAMEAYWLEWIDHPIKALEGKTPREAATDPRLRQELEALLRDIEEDTRTASGRRWWCEGFAQNVRRELHMT